MTFRIAYDYDPENPNPHAWVLDGAPYESYPEAVEAAEYRDREQVEIEGYSAEETMPWLIVLVEVP